MAFDISSLVDGQPSLLVDRLDVGQLCIGAGHGDAWGPPVLVDAGSTDNRADRVIVADGIIETLQDDHTDALTTAVTLGLVCECETLSALSQEVERCHGHHSSGSQDQTNTRSDGQNGSPSPQVLAAVVHGNKTRAASCIHSLAGPSEVQLVREAVGK